MKYLIILAFSLILISCTKPMDEKITPENYHKIVEKIRNNGTPEEINVVQAIISMHKMGTIFSGGSEVDSLKGKSFKEHIAAIQENLKEESKRDEERALKEKQEKDEKQKLLKDNSSHLTIEVNKKEKSSDEFGIRSWVTLTYQVKNLSDKDIDAFEGWLIVSDKLDNELAKFYLKNTKSIKKNSDKELSTSRELRPYSDDRIFEVHETDLKDLTFNYEIEKIQLK